MAEAAAGEVGAGDEAGDGVEAEELRCDTSLRSAFTISNGFQRDHRRPLGSRNSSTPFEAFVSIRRVKPANGYPSIEMIVAPIIILSKKEREATICATMTEVNNYLQTGFRKPVAVRAYLLSE